MCKFLKFLAAVAMVCVLAFPASAWNIKQKSDGTYWENQGAKAVTEYHVLRTYLTVHMSDVSRAASAFVASPIAGFVEKIYVTLHAAFTVTPSVTFQSFLSSVPTGFRHHATRASGEITNGIAPLSFDPGDTPSSLAGDMSAFTTRAATTTNGKGWWADENYVAVGGIIGIGSSGQSSSTTPAGATVVPGTIVIVINPKNR